MSKETHLATLSNDHVACGSFTGKVGVEIGGDVGGNAQENRVFAEGDLAFSEGCQMEFFGAWELEVFLKSMRELANKLYPEPY